MTSAAALTIAGSLTAILALQLVQMRYLYRIRRRLRRKLP